MKPAATRPAPARPSRKAAPAGDGDSTQRIVDSVTSAITERRLMPGTKLAEQRLADLFKVSRTIVRQALNRLSSDKLVTLEPARGARVAQPSVEEARQVFEVRRMLEAAVVKRLAADITPAQLRRLRKHLQQEAAAVDRPDAPGRTRLPADFHVLLAGMLGNDTLAELLGELLSRCSLIALTYPSAPSAAQSLQHHAAIVDALERHDARTAVRLMQAHLQHVEKTLRLDSRAPDLEAALPTRHPA